MSRPLLSLVEQEYRGKLEKVIKAVHRDLNGAVRGMSVKFTFNGRAKKGECFIVEGKVREAHFDQEKKAMLTIDFENPETGTQETVSRYVTDLRV
tara:strand:+ start:257 stop:541 length:285 start_codon:yes stop_codon:yes gene_type:complete